jgi:hypothetical protein
MTKGETRTVRWALLVGMGAMLAACGEETGRSPGADSGLGSGLSSGTGDAHDTEADADAGLDGGWDDGDDGAGPAFDVGGNGADGGSVPEDGCKQVDFLFVIDHSVSMDNKQAQLVAAFPGFMDAIENTLEAGSDYHIMVVDTDEWGRCNTANPWAGHNPGSDTCNNYIKNTVFEECDRELGAGVLHPAGKMATNAVCEPFGGNRYIIEGEPNLSDTFACMATVGTAGHPAERPMDAMVAALQPGINAPGACNAGFLRDDALLVITFISDDPNYEDAGGPQDWYQAVVDAKNGDPNAVVVLGLTPDWPGCKSGSPKGAHWSEFISLWGERGLHGNVCDGADEYVAFFQAAVSTIDQACEQYTPPG